MPVLARVILGCMGLFVVWTMVRAYRSGQIFSRGTGFTIDDQPVLFTLTMFAHLLIVFFFGWLAAGYDTASFLQLFGLDWLVKLRK